jgi:predicted nucleotidyltransferase
MCGMHAERYAQLTQALNQILVTLQKEYKPEKIILFGSMASGNVGEWSDIDLAIIKNTSKPFMERLEEVTLLCLVPVGVDYLVYTPDEFSQMLLENNPFIKGEIVDKGKIIYERTTSSAMA